MKMSDETVSDAPPVTSVVTINGVVTIRTYSDGAVQKNVWDSPDLAQEYADSVKSQGG
jgi:hypothetical protein